MCSLSEPPQRQAAEKRTDCEIKTVLRDDLCSTRDALSLNGTCPALVHYGTKKCAVIQNGISDVVNISLYSL